VHLHVGVEVQVTEVQALRHLSCLTSLTVYGFAAPGGWLHEPDPANQAVLQPTDLPPRLQVFGILVLRLPRATPWLPAMCAVSDGQCTFV
jgi:hypothetical protein